MPNSLYILANRYPSEEVFTKSKAWWDLVFMASEGNPINININVFARRWSWSRTKVRAYIKDLEEMNLASCDGQMMTVIDSEETTEKTSKKTSEKTPKKTSVEQHDNTQNNSVIKHSLEGPDREKKTSEKTPKKATKSATKTLISSLPQPSTEEEMHIRLAWQIWRLLEPLHGHKIPFQNATMENWSSDVNHLMKRHKRAVMDIYDLTKWAVENEEGTAIYFMSPTHLLKNNGRNYEILKQKMIAQKKQHDRAENKGVWTPPTFKIYKSPYKDEERVHPV